MYKYGECNHALYAIAVFMVTVMAEAGDTERQLT